MEPAMCYHWVHEPSLTLGNMLGFMAEESLCLPKVETAPQRTQFFCICARLWPFQSAPTCWGQERVASIAFSIYFKDGEAEISKP